MGFGSMLKDYLDYYKISQTDFAMRLGVSVKHINEIINGNVNLSLELMMAISMITGIDVNLIFYVENKKKMYEYLIDNYKNEDNIKKFLDSFYIKDMNKKNWLVLKDKSSLVQNAMDLLEFLNVKDFQVLDNYLDKRVVYKKRDNANLKKAYLWIKHCDKIAIKQKVNKYISVNLDSLLEELKKIRNKKFDEKELISLFNKYGIYLVIEDALEGTKVRGCMMVKNNNPAIYITKYYKEKAAFYFTLYHEIGHIKSDYNKAKNKLILEDIDDKGEDKCDTFALKEMIDDFTWANILANYKNREEICKENNIPLCFLYSRLAYEGLIKYTDKDYNKNREAIE